MNETSPLLHVAHRADLERARTDGYYRCASLETEGFIHCCAPAQLAGVLERYYAGMEGLVLLSLDGEALGAELRHESPPGGTERFPHVYGPIELVAIRKTTPFDPDGPLIELIREGV